MKRPNNFQAVCLAALVLVINLSSRAATLPAGWQHVQQFELAASGLVRLSLPAETLDAARPNLEDLRLYDEAGKEVPCLIEHPTPATRVIQNANSFQVSLTQNTTVIVLETGLTQALDGISLESPAPVFIKPVQVEGSTDGKSWRVLVQNQPIFRQLNGVSHLHLSPPAGRWRWLRLTVNDQRSQPIPFTGAKVEALAGEPSPKEIVPATITERHENPSETRLALNLGAANLNIAEVQIETTEPLFARRVTLAVPQISEGSISEQTVGQGAIYRVAVAGQPVSANLSVPLDRPVHSRELLLLIHNQDSPPLPISTVRVERLPVYLVFLARAASTHYLLTGNRDCAAPHYDLATLGANLKTVAVTHVKFAPLTDNQNYRAPETLPGIDQSGTVLDVSAWRYRKSVKISHEGAQQLEPGLDVLAHAQSGFADLRLMQGNRQIPYVLERTSISRLLTPAVTATNGNRDQGLSRWIIKLPYGGLPLTRLTCASRTSLFQRNVSLYEELLDERGEKYRHELGIALWTQTPDRKRNEFVLTFSGPVQSDTLFLETHNGDNPSIELGQFRLFYPATMVLFKAKPAESIFLYYGNPAASSPSYDLSLVAGQLLAAQKTTALPGEEEQLKRAPSSENQIPGKGGLVFWGILALVVVALLLIISRLLPKSPPSV